MALACPLFFPLYPPPLAFILQDAFPILLLGDLFLSLFSSKAVEMNHLLACLVNNPMSSDPLGSLLDSPGAAPGLAPHLVKTLLASYSW